MNHTQGSSTTESYGYDAVGNRLSSLGVSPYAYNTSNQLTSYPGATYTYDNNGNTLTKVTSAGTTSYSWDFENRLTSVTLPGSGGTATFKYDPLGRRIQKSSTSGTTNYLYDGANVLEEVDGSGNVLARYVQSLGVDESLAETRGSTTSYYEADGLGSITSMSNSSAALANTYTYDSFGNLTASSGTVMNPYRYTAREFDTETGIYNYRARYYDPTIGRFISEDPIWPGGDLNQYGYASSNAINWTDPFGLKTYVIILCSNENMSDLIGEHAALYVDNGGHPIIFDPGADTQPIGGGEHPADDIFDVPDMMTLSDYIRKDMRERLYTEIIPFDTDNATEAEIVRRARNLTRNGGVRPTQCAKAVSRVLDGLGPFEHLGNFTRPAALARRLRQIRAGGR